MAKTVKSQIELGGKVDGSLLKSMAVAEKHMAKLKKAGGTMYRAAGLAAKAAGVAVAAAGAATVKVVKDSVNVGKQFDSSMAQVAATMGKSVDEIGDLREFALEMGKTTMFSASQAADALNYMALAGYDADTSMKMLPNVLNLAAAGGFELADASNMITDVSSAMGLSIQDTTNLVDQMAKASSNSNTSVSELGEAMLVVGGTAKNMKGGTVEVSQALGLLADNGIHAAEGGTALRNILLGLSSDKFNKTFGALGVSAYDAQGNMRSLEDIFLDLNDAMSDMTVEERTQALSSAFNKVDLKSLEALLGTSKERWEDLAGAISDSAGAAEQMAKTQMDNLAGDITYFQSAMEAAQITLSDALTPALREFVQFGTNEIDELTEMLETDEFQAFASGLAKDMTDAAKAGVEALGDFVDGFGAGFDAAGFVDSLNGVGQAIGAAFGDGSDAPAAKNFGGALAGGLNLAADAIEAATPVIGGVAGAVKFLADNAGVVVPVVAGVAGAFVLINGVSGVAGVITTISGALTAMGVAGPAAGAGLTATAAGESAAGAAAASSVGQMLALGGAVLMIGGGVALAALGIAILAQSAIALASAGAPAIGVLFGLVGAVFAIGAAAYFAGPALTAGAVGMLAFGIATLMVGVGIGIAAAGLSLLAGQLPTIATYGMMAGPALMLMGAGLLVMGAGALVAGAGLLLAAPGLIAFSAAALPASGGITALAGAVGLLAGGIGAAADGIGTMGWGMQSMADNGLAAVGSLTDLSGAASAAAPAVEAAAPAFSTLGTAAQDASGGLTASASALSTILGSTMGLYMAASGAASAFSSLSGGVQGVAAGSVMASSGLAALSGSASAASGATSAAAASITASLFTLPGATSSVVGAFSGLASSLSGSMASARAVVSSACSAMESRVSGMRLHIPSPTVGPLPKFGMSGSFNPKTGAVPNVYVYYAAGGFTGGFTNGPIAIAGEAGTEAIISFDPRYRDQNIAYWIMAGEMLGMFNPFADGGFTDGSASDLSIEIASPTGLLATAASVTGAYGSSSNSVNFGGVTFAPQITVSGTGNQDVLEQLKAAEEDFFDMLDEWAVERESDYAPVF